MSTKPVLVAALSVKVGEEEMVTIAKSSLALSVWEMEL